MRDAALLGRRIKAFAQGRSDLNEQLRQSWHHQQRNGLYPRTGIDGTNFYVDVTASPP